MYGKFFQVRNLQQSSQWTQACEWSTIKPKINHSQAVWIELKLLTLGELKTTQILNDGFDSITISNNFSA